MKDLIMTVLITGVLCGGILWFISQSTKDKVCIGTEMQYYNVECVGEEHKVCKTGEMKFYFNMSGKGNLTEMKIDSLARLL